MLHCSVPRGTVDVWCCTVPRGTGAALAISSPVFPAWTKTMDGPDVGRRDSSTTTLHWVYLHTDANENLHAQLRADNIMHPSAKNCRARLKAIAITQFDGKGPSNSSSMMDYIDTLPQTEQPVDIPELPAQADEEQQPLPLIQGQVLYYLSGWAVFTELRKTACEDCGEYCLSKRAHQDHGYHSLHPVENQKRGQTCPRFHGGPSASHEAPSADGPSTASNSVRGRSAGPK